MRRPLPATFISLAGSCAVLAAGFTLGCERGGGEAGAPTETATPTETQKVTTDGTTDTKTDATTKSRRDHAGAGDVSLKTIPVAGNIYMLQGKGGNIGVSVGADGILIIDDQFAPHADAIRTALRALNPGKLVYLLNTHHHGDHTGGNEIFGREATIIAHENVRKQLLGKGKPAVALPVITFEHGLTVHFNGEPVRAVHLGRGHTDNDGLYFFEKSNVVHMGDTFFNGRFPYIDRNSGGNPFSLLTNVRTVLERIGPDTKIIPGHGDLATRADLETYARMLESTIESVRQQMAQGKSLAQIKKRGVATEWDSWGKAYIKTDKWLTILHTALSK